MSLKAQNKLLLVAFFLVSTTTLGCAVILHRVVEEGQTIQLGDFQLDGFPDKDYIKWTHNGNIVTLMERTGSSAKKEKFALTNEGYLVVKDFDKNDEGKYEASYKNISLAAYGVYLRQADTQVDISTVNVSCEEDGVKRRCNVTLPVHPGDEHNCKKSVKICRISTKQIQIGKKINCEHNGEILAFRDVKSCQFVLEYDDTANDTIKASSKIFLQLSDVWDPHRPYNPQLVQLFTDTEASTTTQRPELETRQQPTNQGTTQSSKITKEQATSTDPQAATIQVPESKPPGTSSAYDSKKQAGTSEAIHPTATTTRFSDDSETLPLTIDSKSPVIPTKEFGNTSASACSSTCIGIVIGVVGLLLVCAGLTVCFKLQRSHQYEVAGSDDGQEGCDDGDSSYPMKPITHKDYLP